MQCPGEGRNRNRPAAADPGLPDGDTVFDPRAREGIVVLSNSVNSVDGLAYRLLTRDFDE